jgi:hypothetical protein
MPQVFVSHSTEDAAIARQVAHAFRYAGIDVWIAPDSIKPGEAYNEAIVAGLRASDALAVLVSKAANASKHVMREVGLADGQGKKIFPIRIEPVEPSDGLAYYLSLPHWTEWHALGAAAMGPVITMLVGPVEVRAEPLQARIPAVGSPPAPRPPPPPPVQANVAVIRVHRPSRGAYAARNIAILIDGEKAGEIANGATVDFTVAPGRREIAARVDYVKSKPFAVDATGAMTRVLELVVPEMTDVGGQLQGLLGQSNFFTWKLLE